MERARQQHGFTLLELMIGIAIFSIILAMSVQTLPVLLKQSTVEFGKSKTEIESVVGLELFRTDVESAGLGLAYTYLGTLGSYQEATEAAAAGPFNDPNTGPPSPFKMGNGVDGSGAATLNGSDYLVVKSAVVGQSAASQGWGYLIPGEAPINFGIQSNDRVIVIKPGGEKINPKRELIVTSDGFSATYQTIIANSPNYTYSLAPREPQDRYIVYGIDPNTDLRFPFNRADYYISTQGVPASCASGTGVLYKATINQANGRRNPIPILNCVADMQVAFYVDTNDDGIADSIINDMSTLTTSELIRQRVKSVGVFILVQEGKRDNTYTFPTGVMVVGEVPGGPNHRVCVNPAKCSGTFVSLACGNDCARYRWKIHTFSAKLGNL